MAGVLLLLGPEEGEKTAFVEQLIERTAGEIGSPPEVRRFYPFETGVSDILAFVRNGSLFAQHRIVVVSKAEDIQRKAEVDLLLEYMKNPVSDATLLLLSDTVRDVNKRLDRAVAKASRKIFWEMFEDRKLEWINAFFRGRGLAIDRDAADFLLEMVQNNTKELRETCERLARYFGEGARLETRHIEQTIYHSKEENVFTLFDRVAARNLAASQEVLAKILLSGESDANAILAGLLWQIRRLARLKALANTGYSFEEAFSRIGLRSKRVQKVYLEAHRNYSMPEVENLIPLVEEFLVRVRSTSSELETLLIQLFLYYAVVRGGLPPRVAATAP